MSEIHFTAWEYHANGSFAQARYAFRESPRGSWSFRREEEAWQELGEGYRPLRSLACGVCATDLARRFLPFPLPQVTGHEVVAADEGGGHFAVEINASHAARGLAGGCPFCAQGLANHCPDRLVLGIDTLPGGFGPWLLAPVRALHPLPADLPLETAVLVEPLAAALHGVRRLRPAPGESVGVLGPRRLGLLVVAALAAERRRRQVDFEIVALHRRPEPLALAQELGADRTVLLAEDCPPPRSLDRVVDTTGTPAGLSLAVEFARREVHLKSTHGRPALGLRHLTEMVVDELSLLPFPLEREAFVAMLSELGLTARPAVAWVTPAAPPPWLAELAEVHEGKPAELLARMEGAPPASGLPRADLAVVGEAAGVDGVVRPVAGREVSLVRPRSAVLVHPEGGEESPLLEAVRSRGLRLTTSRCGDFPPALELLRGDPELRALGPRVVTHTFPPAALAEAFAAAASPEAVKVLVQHEEGT